MGQMTFGPKHSLEKQPRQEESHPHVVVKQVIVKSEPEIVYVDKIIEVIKEVPTEVIKYVEIIKEIPTEVVREVRVVEEKIIEIEKEVIREIDKPFEVIKEIPSFIDRIVVKTTNKVPGVVLGLLGLETIALIVCIIKLIGG